MAYVVGAFEAPFSATFSLKMQLFTDDDVEGLRRRAQALSLASDAVGAESVGLLRSLCTAQRRTNEVDAPTIDKMSAFLDGFSAATHGERRAAEAATKALAAEVSALGVRLNDLSASDIPRAEAEGSALRERLAEVRRRRDAAVSQAEALRGRLEAMEAASVKVAAEVDVRAVVEADPGLALQRSQLDALERAYLAAEERTFGLIRDLRTMGEGNAELLRICNDLMHRLESKDAV